METKYKEGDILVRLHDPHGGIQVGDIRKVLQICNKTVPAQPMLEGQEKDYSNCLKNVRLATSMEIEAYNRGIRNIKDIPENMKNVSLLESFQIF